MSDPSAVNPESGYICVWGTTPREKTRDPEGVVVQCPGCGEVTRMIGKESVPYCSVFYIPLFPEGSGEEFIECTLCGGKFQGNATDIRARIEEEQQQNEELIVEKQRALDRDPYDLEAGSELVELLVGAGRDAEGRALVEKLASHHSEDVNVQVLHARVLLEQDNLRRAREILDRAIGANPDHAGAHYHRAIALASGPAPEFNEALAAAREAHRCGHPNGKAVIAALEEELGKQG